MKFGLITRVKCGDYKEIIGPAVAIDWWKNYSHFTRPEKPTLLIRVEGSNVNFYAAGIPSARRDKIGTAIRCTLFGSLDSRDLSTTQSLFHLFTSLQTDGYRELGELIDQQVSNEIIEDCFVEESVQRQNAISSVLSGIAELWKKWTKTEAQVQPFAFQGSATIGLKNVDAAKCVMHVLEEIQKGRQGEIFFLNLSGKDEYMQILSSKDDSTGLGLLNDSSSFFLGSKDRPMMMVLAHLSPKQKGLLVLIGALLLLGVIWATKC